MSRQVDSNPLAGGRAELGSGRGIPWPRFLRSVASYLGAGMKLLSRIGKADQNDFLAGLPAKLIILQEAFVLSFSHTFRQ